MREVTGNIWSFHQRGEWIVVPTNGATRGDGACVMGRGLALQAKTTYPNLPYDLGTLLKKKGNRVFVFDPIRIITFPVKHHWKQPADLELIQQSALSLRDIVDSLQIPRVYMVRPGCGNGRLQWKDVKPVISRILDDRFIVVECNS